MTERKPMGMTWTSWVDQQIEASKRRGEFEDLPGHGEPLPGLDGRYDPDWWLKDKVKRENLDLTPVTIVARRKVEDWLEAYLKLPTVGRVRRQAEALNEEIKAANLTDLGPLTPQALLDVAVLCARWREESGQR